MNQERTRTSSILVSAGLGVVGAFAYTGASPEPLWDVLAANGVAIDSDVRGVLTRKHFDSLARGQLPLRVERVVEPPREVGPPGRNAVAIAPNVREMDDRI